MRLTFATFLLLTFLTQCKKSSGGNNGSNTDTTKKPKVDTPIVLGADPSWLTQMEDSGYKFYNTAGAAMDCFQLLQSLGINAIRLRVWVNPTGGWCGARDVVNKAVRAKKARHAHTHRLPLQRHLGGSCPSDQTCGLGIV
ncbi:MAG TPA: glycosyl hydrolase 53 family protein [Puia sp.]|nr:glycosyl hydrolase 53 family protein [Puia sp.]